MTHTADPTRRRILGTSLAASAGLLLGLRLPGLERPAQAATAGAAGFAPDGFIRIDPTGPVRLVIRSTEMGQGIYTSSAMLLAEELDIGMDQLVVEAAPPDEALYKNPLLGGQLTGGSTSTRADWKDLRQMAAAARMMLVQAAAARWGVDAASCTTDRAQVRHAASGRSVSYNDLAADAGQLPVPKTAAVKPRSDWKLIGTKQKRLDTPGKVNGSAVYGMDVRVPGMKVGTVAASPVFGGRLQSYDEAAARRVPGVVDVVRTDTALAVIGDHYWAARQGLEAAHPQWDDGPHAAMTSDSILANLRNASAAEGAVAAKEGDVEGAIKGATKKLDAVYQLPFLAHAPMEPINTTLHIRADGADLWVGTQVPVRAQQAIMKATGLPADKVALHNHLIGGGFGRRLDEDSIIQAVAIAKQVAYPVKLIWSREEDIQHDLMRPYYYDQVSAGLDAQGRIVGWTHKVTGASVLARWAPGGLKQGGKMDSDAVEGAAESVYDTGTRHVSYVRADVPGVPVLWWRGVGPNHNFFVVEGFIDELAHEAGQDPVAFRMAMLGKSPRAAAVLKLAAERAGWGSALPANTGRGVSVQFAFGTYLACVLQVRVNAQGEVRVIQADVALDCGPIVNPDTIEAQVQGGLIFGLTAALYNEVTYAEGRVQQSNFHDYRMMRIDEAPSVRVHLIDNPDAPIGGIGETGTVAAAPSLANAIFAASGRRLRRIPFATGQLGTA